jgi:hypothetical protein
MILQHRIEHAIPEETRNSTSLGGFERSITGTTDRSLRGRRGPLAAGRIGDGVSGDVVAQRHGVLSAGADRPRGRSLTCSTRSPPIASTAPRSRFASLSRRCVPNAPRISTRSCSTPSWPRWRRRKQPGEPTGTGAKRQRRAGDAVLRRRRGRADAVKLDAAASARPPRLHAVGAAAQAFLEYEGRRGTQRPQVLRTTRSTTTRWLTDCSTASS